MKYHYFWILIFLLVPFGGYSQQLLKDDWQQMKLQFDMPEVQMSLSEVDGDLFYSLSVDGFYPTTQVGVPNLPLLSTMVEVPICKGYTVTVSDAVYDTIDMPDGLLMPARGSRSKSDTSHHKLLLDGKIYATDAFYRSAELATMRYSGIARDRSLARLQLAPMEYNPVRRQLVVCRKATITVTYDNPDIAASLSHFERYHSPMFAAGATTMNSLYPKAINTAAPVRYLIVAHSSFAGELDDFVAWKRRKGFKVDIVYTSNSAVGTTSSSIAAYVKSQYTNATSANPAPTYLLLVGDHEQIPAFTGSTDSDHITDLDYVTWTSGDNLPDCYTGRFSAQTVTQLTPQIEKTLMYEQYTFADPSFLDRAVMVAGIDGGSSGDFGYTHADPAMDYAITNYINGSRGFTQVKYYKNNTSIVPNATNVTLTATGSSASTSCRNDYNAGAGLINYSAHGSETSWYLPSLSTTNVSAMSNTQKFGVVIGNCCLTNHFQTGTCLGEAFLRKGNYAGAVGYIGGTNSTYWDEDVYWAVGVRNTISASMSMAYNANNRGMYDHLCHTHNESYANWATTLGAIVYVGNMAVESSSSSLNNYYWEIYELMGDPSLMPYLTQASTMTISATTTIPVGTTTLSVSAAPYAYVALTDTTTHTLRASGFANASGNVTLTLPTSLPVGGYEIAASAQQYKTAFKALQIVPANGPYPIVESVVATTDFVAGSTVPMSIEVTNIGNQTASNVSVTLSCDNQDITLAPTSINAGQLTANATTTLSFTATIAAGATDNTTATITAAVSCSQLSNAVISSSELVIMAPVITAASSMQPSSLLPGGEALLTVTLTNIGHAPLASTEMTLTSTLAALTTTAINNTEFSLPAGGTASRTFRLTASSAIANGTIVPLYLALAGESTAIDTIEVYVGENRDETFEGGNFVLEGWTQGEKPWTIVSGTSHGGSYSARSYPQLTHYENSDLTITTTADHADSISFWYRVSSESNYDKFHFYIDGVEMLVNSGEVEWTRVAYLVSAGEHTFLFSYTKDVSVSYGSDCAWIDDVRIPQPIQRYVVSATAANGTTIGSGNYEQGATATIGVMPNSGYTFIAWSDGATDNPRQMTVNNNIQLTANLTANTSTLDTLFITTTDTITEYVQVPYAVHDTTVLVDTVTRTEYVEVHDTSYIAVHDTSYVAVHDTTYIDIPYAVHDTIVLVDTVTMTEYVAVHDTTYIDVPYAVHDTSYVEVHDTSYVEVHDTSYVAVHDTSYVAVHDTTYIDIPYAVHDTIVVDIHDTAYIEVPYMVYDTTIVIDTVTLTEYVEVHDTSYVEIHDTSYIDVPYAVHDTTYISVHDTTYIDVPYTVYDTVYVDVPYAVHDTTYIDVPYAVYDTVYVDVPYAVHDTTYIDVPYAVYDTVYVDVPYTVYDTIYVDIPYTIYDTVVVVDTITNIVTDTVTNTIIDTIDNYIYDTTIVTDTLWMTQYDTIVLYDTVVIHDTIYITQGAIDGVEAINAKIYSRGGQIVVDGAEGNTVWLYDVSGRVLATKRDDFKPLEFDVPASGAYLIKIGRYPARKIVVIR